MILKDLTKVYIYAYTTINDHGEKSKDWTIKGKAYLNIQQDLNELDRKSTGEIDYSTINGRSTKYYNINKGDGISFSKTDKPEYLVTDCPRIGKTILYKMEKNNA